MFAGCLPLAEANRFVAVEHLAPFPAARLHDFTFANARASEVASGCAQEVMNQPTSTPARWSRKFLFASWFAGGSRIVGCDATPWSTKGSGVTRSPHACLALANRRLQPLGHLSNSCHHQRPLDVSSFALVGTA